MLRACGLWVLLLAAGTACSAEDLTRDDTGIGEAARGGPGGGAAGAAAGRPVPPRGAGTGGSGGDPCTNLQCRQTPCTSGGSTTVSGKVFDPAGKNPLYNIVVYVPNAPLEPIVHGATCDSCDNLYTGQPIATALTDASGSFVLQNVPEGADVPLVVQVGKWRRQFVLPSVTACQDNPQPDGELRLPRNRMEGDLPKIAVSTGGADTLECLLRRIGVDPAEYVPGGWDGSVHIFEGSAFMSPFPIPGLGTPPNTSPPGAGSSQALWNSADTLKQYDIVLLSCEGSETQNMNQQALHDYASAGGRVFASHFHYAWFSSGPYSMENLAMWYPPVEGNANIEATIVTTFADGSVFPKGQALEQWLTNVNALPNGKLAISEARYDAEVTAMHTPSQEWIEADENSGAPGATQYFSFNTPTDAILAPDNSGFCGRVVFSDLHVGGASGDNRAVAVPGSCNDADLSPQEKALEFMLFDLSSCVVPDDVVPVPPPIE